MPHLPPVDEIAFSFSNTERPRYDALVATRDKRDFDLSVRWRAALRSIPARAHLRGQSSLDCARKSFAVDLEGLAERPLFEGWSADEFHLLSMCLDEHYIDQITAGGIMRELGLFPLSAQLTSLRIDGQPQGIYLMLQKPSDALRRALPMLHSVVRRDIDIDQKPAELMFARGDANAALADYHALVPALAGLQGEALLRALESKLDLEQFLTWIALMSLFENGDYVDEVMFYATDTVDERGAASLSYSVMGWDADDLFSTCHHEGRFAIVDPHGLLYCAEGVLEHRIFADAYVYARYVDVLERVLATLDQGLFERMLGAAVEQVVARFANDELRVATVEFVDRYPEARSGAGAARLIREAAERLRQSYAARAARLRQRIGSYRAR